MRYQIQCDHDKIELEDLPSECPNCHKSITPNPLFGHYCEVNDLTEVFLFCPDKECKKSFIGYYHYMGENSYSFIGKTSKGTLIGRKFPKSIEETSTDFIKIYNQSLIAEQQELNEICGVGYRKSLEFLIKDYAISINLSQKEKIEKSTLSQCINNFITDSRIQSVAKRASWIGNDETHYVRKWESKNLKDLKKLIDLTIHWIEMEILTLTFEEEMPDKKK
ncbi:hypothetical protein ACFFU1_05160 [Algibacter miyuki]|uniref:DUF4145 domain-containing protein n=1 Tax=Algibacter miyuki TaxID=1306933 RepID=A0ABV5GXA9_9FLAO|nr:hypothetical protein [Algibacter miyuki]MDN3666024.1 hypothetical protein [Algibacter miyuki]